MSHIASTGKVENIVISAAGSGNNTLRAAVGGFKIAHATPGGTIEIGDIFTLTIGENSVSVTATAGTVANVTGLMETAWNAAATPEFTGITALDATTHLVLTGDVANNDFTLPVATTTEGGGAATETFVVALITQASRAKKIRVLSLYMMIDGTVDVRFESGAGGAALTGQMVFDLAGVLGPRDYNLAYNPEGHFETAAAALLNLELSGAISCFGHATIQLVD